MLDKNKITTLFSNLRKKGFIARQGFGCCRNCAGYEIATNISKMTEDTRANCKGAIFYTRQDRDNMPYGMCYLAYGPVDTMEHGTIGLPTLEVGNILAQELRHVGINYEWDGKADSRIMMTDKPVGQEGNTNGRA